MRAASGGGHFRLGVIGDAQPRLRDHVHVVGAVADRHGRILGEAELLPQFDERGALAVAAENRFGYRAGELVAVDNGQPIGARLIETDHRRDAVSEQREASGHQAGVGAVRPHGRDQRARPGGEADAVAQNLLDHRDRQSFQQCDAFAQCRLEGNLAAHGAFGDRRHMRFQAGIVGQLVDALLHDHGGIHVGEKQFLAPVRGSLHHHVDAVQQTAEAFGGPAVVGLQFRAEGNVGGVGPEPLGDIGIGQSSARALDRRRVEKRRKPQSGSRHESCDARGQSRRCLLQAGPRAASARSTGRLPIDFGRQFLHLTRHER